MIRFFALFLFCAFCLSLDQVSKNLAQSYLSHGGIFLWEGLGGLRFSLDLVTNSAAAWGLFASWGIYLVILRMLLVASCLFYTVYVLHGKREQVALALITTGALSNIVDYFLYGHVIDFFHVVLWGYDFPVFNIADSLICIGAFAWFCISAMPPKPRAIASQTKEGTP